MLILFSRVDCQEVLEYRLGRQTSSIKQNMEALMTQWKEMKEDMKKGQDEMKKGLEEIIKGQVEIIEDAGRDENRP